jgi:hypothetical protein
VALHPAKLAERELAQKDMKQRTEALVLNVIAGFIVIALLAAAHWTSRTWDLWLAGVAGCTVGAVLTYKWQLRKRVRFAERSEGSDFEFLRLAGEAHHSIFVIGPSLSFLAREKSVKELLFKKLSIAGSDFRVWMLLSDPSSNELWQAIAFSGDYKAELKEAIVSFRSWLNEAQVGGKPHPNLDIRAALPIATALLFVDADQDEGQVLITPIPWNISPRDRPCFLISKRFQPAVFKKYYDAYLTLFKKARSVADV